MPLTQVSPGLLDTQANAQGFRNRIINGDMRIDQRNNGGSVTPSNAQYTLDRWQSQLSAASKYSIQQSSTAPAGYIRSLLVTSLSAYSVGASDFFAVIQAVEGFNMADFAWGTSSAVPVTLSFQVRSSLTGTFGGSVICGSGSYPFTYTVSSANTFVSISVAIPANTSYAPTSTTNGVGLYVCFGLGVGSTYSGTAGSWQSGFLESATGAVSVVGTNGATFYITGVQLEKGTVATDFERLDYGRQFDQCRRYCEVYSATGTSDQGIPQYLAQTDVNNRPEITLLYYPKRAAPSITVSDATKFSWLSAANTNVACTAFAGTLVGTSTNSACMFFNTASGVTVNTLSAVGTLIFNAAASITVSAEL